MTANARRRFVLRLFVLACAFAFGALLAPRAVLAHAVGVSKGVYTRSGGEVTVDLVFAQSEILALLPALDADGDGAIDVAGLAQSRDDLKAALIGGLRASSGGHACAGTLAGASLTEADGLALRAELSCSDATAPIELDLAFLDQLSPGHRHAAELVAKSSRTNAVAFRAERRLRITGETATAALAWSNAWAFARLGVEHILTGYDHVVFLLALLLVAQRVGAILLVVTAFTVAHSLTFALTAFGLVSLPAWIVEPAIALSVAYVGVENLLAGDVARRWRITFPFGLLHGFGFAGALSEIDLPRGQAAVSLLSFNIGVELGQLALIALLLPVVLRLRQRDWFTRRAVPIASAAVVTAGVTWFIARTWS